MNSRDSQRYLRRLQEIRDRVSRELPRLVETVQTDARAPGEHDPTVSESADKELILEHAEEDIRGRVLAALRRLEEGTFGKCQTCGKPIGKARLDTIPYTPYCVACEREIEAE